MKQMRKANSVAVLLFFVILAGGIALAYATYALFGSVLGGVVVLCATFLVASTVSSSIKVAAPSLALSLPKAGVLL